MNGLGYALLGQNKSVQAIQVIQFMIEPFVRTSVTEEASSGGADPGSADRICVEAALYLKGYIENGVAQGMQ